MAGSLMDVFVKIGADTSGLESGIDKAKGLAGGLGSAIGTGLKVAGAAIGAATTAVGAFAKSSIEVGKTFDSSMSQVAATMGVSVDEIGELRDYAMEMGATTAFSATQAADALNYMALAGYDADTSMQMLPNVLNLAAAGGIELAHASDMVTDAQSALGLSLEDTTELVDMMAKTSSKSNTSVQQLGDAILTIGGTAKTLAGGTTELNTALGILADNGIKGAEGGTKLRNVILSLSAPTDTAAKELERLGVKTVDETTGNFRELEDIMADLGTSLDGLGTADRAEIISTIFNKQDIAAVNALLDTSSDRWEELAGAIDDSKGAAEEMANTQLQNLEGDITLFKSALEGAKILVSDALTPALRDFVKFGTAGLTKISDGFKSGGLSGAMDAFKDVLSDGIGMVTELLPDAINAGMELLSAIGQGITDNADVILNAAIEVVTNIMQSMLDAAEGDSKNSFVLGFFQTLASAFMENAPKLMNMGFQIFQNIVTGLAQSLPEIIPTAIEMILTLVTGLLDNVDLLVDSAIALVTGLAEGLINALPILIEKAPEIIAKLVEALIINLPKLMIASAEIISKLVVGIIQNLPRMLEAGMQIITTLQTGIARLYVKLLDAGKQAVNKVKEGIKSIDPVKWGQDMIDSFIRGIKDRIARVGEAAREVAETVKSFLGFSEPEEGPLSNFHTFAPDMMELFAKGIKDNEDVVRDQIAKSFDFMDSAMTSGINTDLGVSSSNGDVIRLLQEIANKDFTVVLEGDMDRVFRVMQSKSRTNHQITGQPSFA